MKVLDLFSGCGGFSKGFADAGFETIAFVEWWKPAATTFLHNHLHALHLGTDITQISDKKIEQLMGKVEIVVGGPPCQGFSLCGKRDKKDQRNTLYKEYLRFIRILLPKIAIMENVAGLLSMKNANNEPVINLILKDFIDLGYSVTYKVLKASDYGVPQNRKRLIIIATKLNLYPEPKENKITVHEAIKDLPFEETQQNGHVHFKVTQSTQEKINNLKQGERISNKFNFSRQRIYANKPSKTIVTHNIYIHPYYNRFLTPRELARLQSFPDDFIFCGAKTAMTKQIGNAVPPLLAKAIATKIKESGIL